MKQSPILTQIYLAHRKLTELEKTPRRYGTDDLLFSSDVHTLAALYNNEGCNLTELAEALDVSKPAAFKFVKKLASTGYIIKGSRPGSARDVAYRLSVKGQKAVKAHRDFQDSVFGPLEKAIQRMPRAEQTIVQKFLEDLNGEVSW